MFSCLDAETTAQNLTVGMELSYPPFETIDTEGNPKGISVELAYKLGDYLHRPVVIENIPFIGLIPSLKNGRLDLILSSLSVTPDRQKVIDYSIPYLETGLCLLVPIYSSVSTIAELDVPGRRVVVKQGTTGEVYAKNHLKQAKILILDTESSCVMEVVQGKADAFIYDQFSIFTQWQKNKKTTKALLDPFYKEYWAMGIKKGNGELVKEVNAFITQIRKNGDLKKLAEKYLPEQHKEFKAMGIPFFDEF